MTSRIAGAREISMTSRSRPIPSPSVGGLLRALGLMVTLPIDTWIRLAIWNERFASLAQEEEG
jgi:hypothetical protein